ncbi:TetR/AcrR family transcriptional regulator [Streptomyces sp. NPDC005930]|uniref:TetR/AcrR family transcriptional regulator n=1 Tax=Streptomyces sp. NPDC005930 TaxID=3364736 RepID=UPI0036C4DFBB
MTHESSRGRPRSESARVAVLHAVDDLLVEVGYAAMTMKGIAERAGVGRQTVYRWWSNKAEVLYEASALDAKKELAVPLTGHPQEDLTAFLDALVAFLAHSHAGAAYRALLGEAQHDPDVAALLKAGDIVGESATAVVAPLIAATDGDLKPDQAVAALIGPAFFHILSGRPAEDLDTARLVQQFLQILDAG